MRDIEELITLETPHHHHDTVVAMTSMREDLSSHGLISTTTDPLIASSAPADQPLIPASVPLHGGGHTPFPFQHGDTDIVDQVGPPSVFNAGGLTAEEDLDRQITCEDVEEATEEARTERRGVAMLKVLQLRLEGRSAAEPCTISELTVGNSRKAAAAKFYTLLSLCKVRGVELVQTEGPYSNIFVQKGLRFAPLLSSA